MDRNPPSLARPAGLSLIELLVAITIGLWVAAGLTLLMANASASRAELEKLNRQIENGRYAFEVLADDVRHAGYYGLDTAAIAPAAAPPDACATSAASLAASLGFPVQGISNYAAGHPEAVRAALFSCLPAAAILAGTDVLAIRRAGTAASSLDAAGNAAPALAADTAHIQAGLVADAANPGRHTAGFVLAVPPANNLPATFTARVKTPGTGTGAGNPPAFATPAPVRRFLVRLYFVSPCSQPVLVCPGSGGLPSLKRLELGAGPGFPGVPEVIAEGIEDFQVDFGVNDLGSDQGTGSRYYDGSADHFVQCNPASATTYEANCVWQDVVSLRLHLLARNADPTPGYVDSRRYLLGLKGSTGPRNDAYKRHAYVGFVRLNNVGMARECTPTAAAPC